jgi:mannose/fructose-specific phosphotransferase system component IIA
VTKVDYAKIGQQENVCALVTVSEDNAKRLFERVMNSAPTKLSPEDETLLYLNFLKSENQ